MILTYKYRLFLSKKQHQVFEQILEDQRELYNAALEERIECYKKTGKSIILFDQFKSLTEWRKSDTYARGVSVNIQRWTLTRLNEAYTGFFEKRNKYPRFKSKTRWRSFGYIFMSGLSIKGNYLWVNKPRLKIKINLHRELPNENLRSCRFHRDLKGWYIHIQVKIPEIQKCTVNRSVGIDLGLRTFAYQSDGIAIQAPQFDLLSKKVIRLHHKKLSRCKNSKRKEKIKNALRAAYRKTVNQRRTWLHTQSTRIVNAYDLIAIEDLQIQNLHRNSRLSRSISNASWGTFSQFLAYKAARAGKHLVKVDPKNTSQRCSSCLQMVPKGPHIRWHSCSICGLELDRDHNAALNILQAVAGLRQPNVVGYDKRAVGNFNAVESLP